MEILEHEVGIAALVPDTWQSVHTTRHHVLERLAARFQVAWLEPSLGWREHWLPPSAPLASSPLLNEPPGQLHVMPSHPLLPALYRFPALNGRLLRHRVELAFEHLRKRGARHIGLYLWRPEFAPALACRGYRLSCYHIDDEYSFSTTEQPNSPEEIALIRGADQVIVHSPRLMRKKGGINPHTTLIPNGVDYAAFATERAEPADLRSIPRPRIGYTGVIKKQLDLALLLELARKRRDWSFVLVGPVGTLGDKAELWRQIETEPNVYPLGARNVTDLPAYVQHFDAALMCYEVNDYTNSIFPLKLNEYLAAGRPVVSSRIESVLQFTDVVNLASGAVEWEQALSAALQDAATPNTAESRRAVARNHDWSALVDRIAGVFLEGIRAKLEPRAIA